jgi:hypothetical protein
MNMVLQQQKATVVNGYRSAMVSQDEWQKDFLPCVVNMDDDET